jgi:tetratricopeptide (TPR) repeat protein
MEDQADQINDQEKQLRNEMLFTLSERDRGTLAMVVTPNEWKQKELHGFLKDHLKEYTFFDLDLTAHTYTSLYRALQELLPKTVQQSEPVQYLVNVTGLESSLYKTEDGRIEFSPLVAQLNFERELIFNQPYIILLWVSEGFDKEVQKKAPDLMHWMSKRFVFKDGGPDGMTVAEEAVEYGVVRKKGKVKERLERIAQLEETWERLCLYNKDQARLVRDKINLLRLLGKEYAAAFMYDKAEDAFLKAIALDHKIGAGLEGRLLFETGEFYYDFNKYELSLQYLLKALEAEKIQENGDIRSTLHMIGMAYQGLRKWGEALKYYTQALEWCEKNGFEYGLGNTYHQIGMVYEEQRQWGEAMQNYQQALEGYEKTGNEYELGGTYHQIGIVFQQQGKWAEALKNYEQALKWKEKTGNEYGMGLTYHQIGIAYAEQAKWEEALTAYEEALEWMKKTGNEYGMGLTYHQIGRVYEEMGEYAKALDYFEIGNKNDLQHNDPQLSIGQSSLARIRKKLAEAQSPNPDTTP